MRLVQLSFIYILTHTDMHFKIQSTKIHYKKNSVICSKNIYCLDSYCSTNLPKILNEMEINWSEKVLNYFIPRVPRSIFPGFEMLNPVIQFFIRIILNSSLSAADSSVIESGVLAFLDVSGTA